MKTARFVIALAILILSSIDMPGHAQKRRRPRPCPEPQATSTRAEANDAGKSDEQARIVDECATPGRPMPAFEVEMPVLSGKAISLPKPPYPPEAKAAKADGTVVVKIVGDETGRVIWAEAVEGHPLLRRAAAKAACQARYSPLLKSGRAVRAGGRIFYNFQL